MAPDSNAWVEDPAYMLSAIAESMGVYTGLIL
jgi:hypothetical protein